MVWSHGDAYTSGFEAESPALLTTRLLDQFRRWPALVLEWSTYPPLLITLALAIAVTWGAGAALGVPELLWHERWPTQLVAALALGALCAELGVVGYLLHARAP